MLQLHKDVNFNYQMNRSVYLGNGNIEDIKKISCNINDCVQWKTSFIRIAGEAEKENRLEQAATYYRMSEFFTFDSDPDKEKLYDKSIMLFYKAKEKDFENGSVKKYSVPFNGKELPVLHKKPEGTARGTILIHGGNDSYIEEFWNMLSAFSEAGYDAYAFEGPGQGSVLRKSGIRFDYRWELPVKAVLDYFHLDDVTIIGASLGGVFAQRAAAFEKRITKVVAWPAFLNLQDAMIQCRPPKVQKAIRFFLKMNFRNVYNKMIYRKIRNGDTFLEWAMKHGMYAYGADSPYDYLEKAAQFQITDVVPEIRQHVLLLGGLKDHMIPYEFTGEEMKLLTNAASVTARIFSEKENAGLHCNVDNTSLVLNTILNWMEQVEKNCVHKK